MKAFMIAVFITPASADAVTTLAGIDTTNDHQEVTEEELRQARIPRTLTEEENP